MHFLCITNKYLGTCATSCLQYAQIKLSDFLGEKKQQQQQTVSILHYGHGNGSWL